MVTALSYVKKKQGRLLLRSNIWLINKQELAECQGEDENILGRVRSTCKTLILGKSMDYGIFQELRTYFLEIKMCHHERLISGRQTHFILIITS